MLYFVIKNFIFLEFFKNLFKTVALDEGRTPNRFSKAEKLES